MDWQKWMDRTHPVRALLALSALGATIYMLVSGIVMPDGWWIIVTALCLFYVEAIRPSST